MKREGGAANRNAWVALMYHDVIPDHTVESAGANFYSVPVSAFERQLDLLAEHGLPGRSVAEMLAGRRGVAVTFDDGNAGQFSRAFPALTARDMTATFYITTSWVGEPDYVTWAQLEEMRAAGMSIQSHTHRHRFLSELTRDELRFELEQSKELLDERLGQDTSEVALPGGDWPRRRLRPMIAESGYRVVGTSEWRRTRSGRPSDAPHTVGRATVRAEPATSDFLRIARGNRWFWASRQVRYRVLTATRDLLGPSRYASWRRGLLKLARGRP